MRMRRPFHKQMSRPLGESIKIGAKRVANVCGLDVQRLQKSPRHNALGLRSLGIRTVIDVGANSGQFAQYISSILPEARLLCFEPLPGPFEDLKGWARKRNGAVVPFNIALGDTEGTVDLFEHVDHSPSSSLLHATPVSHSLYPLTRRESTVKVVIERLDEVVRKADVSTMPEVLIKLDVQGYEDKVIRGGEETFARAKACISEINFDTLYEDQCSFREVWSILDRLGYVYAGNLDQEYAQDGHVVFADCLFLRS